MRRIVAKRLLGALVQVLVVTLLAWLLFYVIARFTGASPAQRIAGKNATPSQVTLVSRLLMTAGDLITAGTAAALARGRGSRERETVP